MSATPVFLDAPGSTGVLLAGTFVQNRPMFGIVSKSRGGGVVKMYKLRVYRLYNGTECWVRNCANHVKKAYMRLKCNIEWRKKRNAPAQTRRME